MKRFRHFAFVLLLLASLSISQESTAQFSGKNYDISGFTKTADLKVVNDHSQTTGLNEIGEAYSKARGATIFSPMNKINNRARKKLLEEASVRGASHVWIVNRTTEGGFGRFVSFHAVFYRHGESSINAQRVAAFLQDGSLKPIQTLTADRNASGLKTEMIASEFKLDPSTIQTKDNRVFVDNIYIGGNAAKAGINPYQRTFEVIGINDEYIVVAEVLQEGKTYQARLYQKISKL